MPYKIVQTEENNKTVLTIVPKQWEKNGTLFWPIHRNETKLIYDEHSVPRNDWKRIPCVRKRELQTLSEAERELDIMEQASDTDADIDRQVVSTSKQRNRPLHNTRLLQPIDLNDQIMFRNPVSENVQANENYNQAQDNNQQLVFTLSTSDADHVLQTNPPQYDLFSNIPIVAQIDPNSCTESTSNSNTYTNSDSQSQVLAQLIDNQEKIMSQLAVLQASVDFLLGQRSKTPGETYNNRLPFAPAQTKKELDDMENKLQNEEFYSKSIDQMTHVCGTSGKAKGVDSAYKLIDYFITRQMLLQCNWTGSTRDQNLEPKVPLKYYIKVRSCFLDIIRKSDINFSETEADKFFKVIIKNAKARLQTKNESVTRVSKPRVIKQKTVRDNQEKIKDVATEEVPDQQQNEMNIETEDKNNEELSSEHQKCD